MKLNRRSAFMMALALAGVSGLDPTKAQQPVAFDPISIAKLRAGEMAREIEASPRDRSASEPSRDSVFNTGLILQAGLRALLPVKERSGVALPGAPSPQDERELVEAQENYKAVFESGAEATPQQKAIAVKALELAAGRLKDAGYEAFSKALSKWLEMQGVAR